MVKVQLPSPTGPAGAELRIEHALILPGFLNEQQSQFRLEMSKAVTLHQQCMLAIQKPVHLSVAHNFTEAAACQA